MELPREPGRKGLGRATVDADSRVHRGGIASPRLSEDVASLQRGSLPLSQHRPGQLPYRGAFGEFW
jgi:hypothetical protein